MMGVARKEVSRPKVTYGIYDMNQLVWKKGYKFYQCRVSHPQLILNHYDKSDQVR